MSVDPVSLAITIGLNLASMALTASKHIEGPRVSDLKASTADYGVPLPQFYGTKRIQCICIYAEDIREEKHQNKTKGGKYNEYRYFGTWASLIADNEIDAVLRLYFDAHLVLDRTGNGGPITPLYKGSTGTGLSEGSNFRVYLGTEDQMPDPRLLAKIEAKEGVGTCPAYKRIAYIVFEEIPLDPFGNRLPQVAAQATRNAIPHYPYEIVTTEITESFAERVFSPSGNWMAAWWEGGVPLEWWDVPTRTRIGMSPAAGTLFDAVANVSLGPDGTAYFMGSVIEGAGSSKYLFACAPMGVPTKTVVVGSVEDNQSRTVALISSDDSSGVYTAYLDDFAGYFLGPTHVPYAEHACDWCFDDDEVVWMVSQPTGAGNAISLVNMNTGDTLVIAGSGARTHPSQARLCYSTTYGHFFIVSDGYWYTVTKSPLAVTASGAVTWGGRWELPEQDPGRSSFWALGSTYDEHSLADGALLSSSAKSLWVTSFDENPTFDPTNHAVWSLSSAPTPGLVIRYLDRAMGGPWTLGAICADVADQCGMRTIEQDFTDLDQPIPGYLWTQAAGKDIVGPLLELHDSDIRPHGFIQQGLKRGKTYSAGTISTDWMVNENRGEDPTGQPLYSMPITSETDMPLRIAATFSDPAMDEQPNTASAQRNAVSVKTSAEKSFDFTTLSEDPATMQGLIERVLRRYWVGSTKPTFLLSPLEIRLEPADVRPLLLEDGELLRVRATKVTLRANRVQQTEWEVDGETQVNAPSWELDNASPLNAVYSTPGAFTYGRPPEALPIQIQTRGFVFDTPLLSDSDDQGTPFLYDAASPYSAAALWSGAMVWTSNDPTGDYTGNWDAFSSGEASVWGFAMNTLPAAVTDVIDEGSHLDVTVVGGGSLSSITEDQMLNSQALNLALVGTELIQFRDAEPIGTNEYRLTGLVRGARNSEYAVASHATGETFLLIGSHVHKRTVGAGEIGDTGYYKFSGTGFDLDTTAVLTVPFAANANRPPAPTHLELHRNTGTGDWSISWVRRTRVGGGSVNGQDVPLGETSEVYRVKIMNGAVVVSAHDVTSPAFTYTAAQQATDWGGAQTALTVEVCQMSPALSLEGFEASASG